MLCSHRLAKAVYGGPTVPWLGYSCQTPNHSLERQLRKISRPTRPVDEDFLPPSVLSFFLPPFLFSVELRALCLLGKFYHWAILPVLWERIFKKTIYYYTSTIPMLPLIMYVKAFELLLHELVCVEISERNYFPLLWKARMPYSYI